MSHSPAGSKSLASFLEITSAFELLRNKTYISGWISEMHALNSDGSVPRKREWALYYAFLRGTQIAFFRCDNMFDDLTKKPDRVQSDGFINVSDAIVNLVGIYQTDELKDIGVLSLNTAGANRIYLQPLSDASTSRERVREKLDQWITALRLSILEHNVLSEWYTIQLLKPYSLPQADKVSMEGYLQIRMAGHTQWQKYYCLLHDIGRAPVFILFIRKQDCEKYQSTKKTPFKSSGKQRNPLKYAAFQLSNPTEIFALYPEKLELLECSTIFKIQHGSLLLGKNAQLDLRNQDVSISENFGTKVDSENVLSDDGELPSYLMCTAESHQIMLQWLTQLRKAFITKNTDDVVHQFGMMLHATSDTEETERLSGLNTLKYHGHLKLQHLEHVVNLRKQSARSIKHPAKVDVSKVHSRDQLSSETDETSGALSESEGTSSSDSSVSVKLSPKRKKNHSPHHGKEGVRKHSDAHYKAKKVEPIATPTTKRPHTRQRRLSAAGTQLYAELESGSKQPVQLLSSALNSHDEQLEEREPSHEAKLLLKEKEELEHMRREIQLEKELLREQLESLRIMRQQAKSEIGQISPPMSQFHQVPRPVMTTNQAHQVPFQFVPQYAPPYQYQMSSMQPLMHANQMPHNPVVYGQGYHQQQPQPLSIPHHDVFAYAQPTIPPFGTQLSPTPSESASLRGESLLFTRSTHNVPDPEEMEDGQGGLVNIIAEHSRNRSSFYNPHLGVMQQRRDEKAKSRRPPRRTGASSVVEYSSKQSLTNERYGSKQQYQHGLPTYQDQRNSFYRQ